MIVTRFASLAVLALFAASASAQSSSSSSMAPMAGMGAMHHNNASMHKMPATVTAVDEKTGLVDVTSAGMALKVHFPPAALAGLKAGDTITLHLGFTKP